MYNESILNEELKSFDYYVSKIPMYLRRSYGFIEHFRIWHELLISTEPYCNVVEVYDSLLYLLNIFDNTKEQTILGNNIYLENLCKLEDSGASSTDKYGDTSDILDKIGSLFGVRRSFSVTISVNGQLVEQELTLNNFDFLILIKAQIVKNYYDGSYEQVQKYYEDVGLNLIVTSSTPAHAELYLQRRGSFASHSANVESMFLSGLLTIESMGVTYSEFIMDLTSGFIWDETNWDEKEWY